MILSQGKLTPELARDFAKRAKPMIPVFRDLLEGVAKDARPVLDAEQARQMQREIEKQLGMLEKFEARMKRWADGDVKEKGEDPFDDLEPTEKDDEADGEEVDKETKQRRQALKHARRSAKWELRRIGPSEWSRFLIGAQYFLRFDDEQVAKAEALLEDYRGRAEAIMTDEWKQRLRRNRIRHQLRWQVRELADGPWMYHLTREYEELAGPIRKMGWDFRKEVLALAADEQREAALARIREQVEKHGLTMEPMDAEILGLKPQ